MPDGDDDDYGDDDKGGIDDDDDNDYEAKYDQVFYKLGECQSGSPTHHSKRRLSKVRRENSACPQMIDMGTVSLGLG